MANPPFDPYGNPIPANPGAKRVTEEDGTVYPIRSNLALENITVTDDPATDTTTLIGGSSVDFSAAGTAMAEAADASAQRELLGIDDIGDLRNYAIGRAQELLGLTRPSVAVDESFVVATGSAPNFFAGTSSNVSARSGGWKKITAGAVAGNSAAWSHASPTTAQAVSNVGTAKWYLLALIKPDVAVDSTAQLSVGLIDTGLASQDEPMMGFKGSASTTKFRFFDGTTGVNSTVDADTGVHLFEMWCDGAGHIYGSVDQESAVTYTTAKTAAATPYVEIVTGSGGAQSASIGHYTLITDN